MDESMGNELGGRSVMESSFRLEDIMNDSSKKRTNRSPRRLKKTEDQDIISASKEINRILLKTKDEYLAKKIATYYRSLN